MARISTYAPDVNITINDKILGSSYEGKQGNNLVFKTANFKVADLLSFVSKNIDVTVDGINYSLGNITGDISENQEAITDLTNGLSDLTDQLLDQVDLFVGFTGSVGSLNPDGSILGLSQNFANNLISSVTTIDQDFANNLLGIAEVTEQFANDVLGISTSVAYATADQFDLLEGVVLEHTNDIDAINANVITLGTSIDENTGAITSTASDLSLLATRVTVNENTALAIQTDLTTLTSTVNENTGDITANATDISALGVRVTSGETNVTALQTDLTSLTTTVNANTGDITANATDISNLGIVVDTANADIAALDSSLTSLTATVDGNTGDIAVNATNIETLGTNVETAQADISALDLSLTTLTTTVDGNTGDIATNATDLNLLTTRVTDAEADITAVATDVTSLTTTVDGNTGDISTNASDISVLSTSVTNAEDNITAIQADLTTLETTVDGQTGDIATNAANITSLGTSVTTAEANITSIQSDLTALETTVDGQTGDIAANATAISTLGTTVSTNGTDITNLSTSLTELETTVDGNTGDISTNATAIDTLSTSIDGLGTTVSALSTDVTNLSTTVSDNGDSITANATNISTLGVTVGDNTANITSNSNAIATTDGKLSASYGMHVNAGGKVAGLKLLADSTTTSSFIAQADTFGVEMPNGNRVLTVDSGGLLLNGSGVFTGNISARSGDFGGWEISDNVIKGPELAGYELVLNPVSGIAVNSSDYQDSRVLSIRKGDRPITANAGAYTFTNVDGVNFNSWNETITESVTSSITKSAYPIGITGSFSGTERLGTFQDWVSWPAINGIASTSSDFSGSVEVGLYVQFANYFDFRTSSLIGTEKITSASITAASTTLNLPAVTNKVINLVNSQDPSTIYFRFIFERSVKLNSGSVTFSAKSTGASSGLDLVFNDAPFQTDLSPGGVYVGMGTTRYFRIDTNSYFGSYVVLKGGLSVTGGISTDTILKGSGSFRIDHPIPEKKDTHHLVHSFVESPQANNIYRGQVNLVNGQSVVNLDEAAGMTEGTFILLNRDIHTFTSNESDWDHVRGTVDGNILTIECQNPESTAKVSWLVIGERHDQHMYDTNWTDENGKVIVEPLKEEDGQNS
jgi:peptidoglycan hydrolase CwlO-like protein